MNRPKALVLGMGRSGAAAAELLRAEAAAVTVLDAADGPALRRTAAALRRLGCDVHLAARALPEADYALCVVSPGLAYDHAWLQSARARGIPVLSEVELGWQRLKAPTVAVTGSNGKSTLVKLCAETMIRAGLRVCIAGNYGVPASRVALSGESWDWVVLEVSSFQLENVVSFRPRVGVILNILPNHLDRHRDMRTYRALKLRLLANRRAGDLAVLPCDLKAAWPPGLAAPITFGVPPADFACHDGRVWAAGKAVADLRNTMFDNPVWSLTAAAATAVMHACGVAPGRVTPAVRGFQGLPHRFSQIGCHGGVRVVDDSKSTNVAALCAALSAAGPPIRLIAGGRGKGESFAPALPVMRNKVAAAYLIGADAPRMAADWGAHIDCRICGTLERACAAALTDASPGDTVLLSPACASFDQFRDYAERGEQFRRMVAEFYATAGIDGKSGVKNSLQ